MIFNIGTLYLLMISAFTRAEITLKEIETDGISKEPNDLPISIYLRFPLESGQFNLLLNLTSSNADETSGNYIETLGFGEFLIKKRSNNSGFEYYGGFSHEQLYYHLAPSSNQQAISAYARIEEFIVENDTYTLTSETLSKMSGDSYFTGASAARSFTIETFLHIDYSLYAKWLRFMNDDAEAAMRALKNYYSQVIHGVNANYERIERSDFSISVHLTTFYVGVDESLFKEKHNSSDQIQISYLDAIRIPKRWLKNSIYHKKFDAMVFIANLNMGTVVGVANLKEICKDGAITVISHLNQLELTSTTIHEIGHILGAKHDDSVSNDCRSRDQNIMAPLMTELRSHTRSNAFYFSPCSISYFKMLFNQLDRNGKNCLLNAGQSAQDIHEDEFIGQSHSADDQCKLLYGPQSYYCGGINNLCDIFKCYRPLKKTCSQERRQRAADGTHCGDRRWCLAGTCVQDDRAPPSERGYCIYGDFKDKLEGKFSHSTCKQVAKKEIFQCYHTQVQQQCCATCLDHYEPKEVGCEYGDKDFLCSPWVLYHPAYCRLKWIAEKCCHSCPMNYPQSDGAKFDPSKATKDCKDEDFCDFISPNHCYDESFQERCCYTCVSIATPERKGCEFGSRIEECENKACSKECCSNCDDHMLKTLF